MCKGGMKYRVRMVHGKWYVMYYDSADVRCHTIGPYDRIEGALAEAEASGCPDWDKGKV